MPLHIVTEAERCLQCKNPMCQKGCPVHTPIPQVIQLFKEHKLMEAGEMLFRNNPLSLVCSMVCNHAKQCAGNCIRGRKDSPVHFSSIETYISDMYLDRMHASVPLKRVDKKVAVIGAGPAGITVAVMMAAEGYHVTIFEWKSKIGGVMQYGIPEFRLQKSILDRYEARLEEMGIQIRLNATIGSILMIDDLFRDGYDSIFVGTGAERPRTLGIRGESLGNVHFAMNYLANPKAHHLGNRVAVIGVGNAAMDVARTALRNGTKSVTLYAMGKEIAASSSEVAYAQLDGAEIETGMQVQEITEDGPVFCRTIYGENDEIVGHEDERIQVHADSTIISISQIPRGKLVRTTSGLTASEHGLLIVDENYMTTRAGVFAAGDVVTGAKTVVHAVDGAKKAAEAMMKYMNGELEAKPESDTQE
ncbi:MAG: NAD(P)-dependent oxidoreductase [Synergistaceae bacterium]|nr:NAD(P)-dependent oxidoreductase [Synergistaceae bacterium]MBQ3345655.1 NAD(P)-dependent oxidoreductase [Synergistaceae bacterium]MBQ3397712.1 NAD(P)-dependent oxidoreductase [Synergistaceae bacterium]MBQ3758679.1 NAD(P)-dependent oxidoreductase [Synergistaceae bacterium]MBQ6418094.1 NAD(P)-dependent oxidoreductase [Synergistaceae bacterium]